MHTVTYTTQSWACIQQEHDGTHIVTNTTQKMACTQSDKAKLTRKYNKVTTTGLMAGGHLHTARKRDIFKHVPKAVHRHTAFDHTIQMLFSGRR